MREVPVLIAVLLLGLSVSGRVESAGFVHGITVDVDGEEYHLDGPADGPDGERDMPGHFWVRSGPKRLTGKHYNTGPFETPQWWSSDAPDGARLYNVKAIIDEWTPELAERYAGRGYVHYHRLVRVTDHAPHPSKVAWMKHHARRKFTLDGGPAPQFAHAVRPGVDFEFIPNWATPYPPDLAELVEEVIGEDVLEFAIVEIEMPVLAMRLEQEEAVLLPVVAEGPAEPFRVELASQRVFLRDIAVIFGFLKEQAPNEPEPVFRELQLTVEQNYRVGECLLPRQQEQKLVTCGAVTILDEAQTMVSGMVLHPETGMSFFEPVDLILGGRNHPGMHIVYNAANTVPPPFSEEESPVEPPQIADETAPQSESASAYKETSIVLDGDRQFYQADPDTVWSRQEAIHNSVVTIYEVIEPLSSFQWGLKIPIKGQEVWVAGGPDTTNKDELINELKDPSYYLLNPVDDEELHFFLVGYNVSGVYGKASGIGSAAGGFGGGPGLNHAYGEARTSQSLKTKWVVMAHEVGHLIGGQHGDGILDDCAGGFFPYLCGPSIMPAGSAGSPETREAYFSDDNDDNVEAVLNGTGLPDW